MIAKRRRAAARRRCDRGACAAAAAARRRRDAERARGRSADRPARSPRSATASRGRSARSRWVRGRRWSRAVTSTGPGDRRAVATARRRWNSRPIGSTAATRTAPAARCRRRSPRGWRSATTSMTRLRARQGLRHARDRRKRQDSAQGHGPLQHFPSLGVMVRRGLGVCADCVRPIRCAAYTDERCQVPRFADYAASRSRSSAWRRRSNRRRSHGERVAARCARSSASSAPRTRAGACGISSTRRSSRWR